MGPNLVQEFIYVAQLGILKGYKILMQSSQARQLTLGIHEALVAERVQLTLFGLFGGRRVGRSPNALNEGVHFPLPPPLNITGGLCVQQRRTSQGLGLVAYHAPLAIDPASDGWWLQGGCLSNGDTVVSSTPKQSSVVFGSLRPADTCSLIRRKQHGGA